MKSGGIGKSGMESGIFPARFRDSLKDLRRSVLSAIIVIALLPGWAFADDTQGKDMVDVSAEGQAAPIAVSGDAFKLGDIAATAFSGSKLIVDTLPPGVDPVSKTFLNPDGIVLRIFSLPSRGDPNAQQTLNPASIYQAQARDIGHIFALAFDSLPANGTATPGLYAAATSAFGLQIVGPDSDGDGQPDRLTKGATSAAFMTGQFGTLPNAGPSTVFKVDQATGNITVFANVTTNGSANSGPGIGGLAFDPASRTLFASDLETGLIHAFAGDGSEVDEFDHGVNGRPSDNKEPIADDGARADITSEAFDASNPATWGFTQPGRRIDALAVHNGRLYYAVAEGPEIWSIGIDAGGKFASDPRFEIAPATERPFPITGLAFDNDGRMIATQRGTVENPADYSHFTAEGPAQTLRFTAENPDDHDTSDRWKHEPDEYAVGNGKDNRSSAGGLALQYAYKDDGSIDPASCGGTLIVSADALGAKTTLQGLQLNAVGLVRPANVPPSQSSLIDLVRGDDDAATRGYAGGVAALQDCNGGGFPPVAEGGDASDFPPVAEGGAGEAFPPVDGGDAGAGETGGGDTAFPPVDDTQPGGGGTTTNGQLELTKTPASATCAENQSCSFKITVKNTSDQPANTISISDNPTIGGVPFAKFKLGDVATPWQCVAAAAPGLTCTHPALQPNESADLTLSFTPDAGSLAGAAEFKNCVSFANGNAPADQAKQQQALPPPPATSSNNGGLKVETLGTTPTCSPATGNCEFEIKITNTSGQPIKDQPLKIFDTLTVGSQTQAKNEAKNIQLPPGLQCKPEGREFNCSQNSLTLDPNQSVTLKVAFAVDTTEGGQADFVQNKTNVTLGPLTGSATAAIGILDDKKLPEPDANGQQADGANGQGAAPACASIPITRPGPVVINKKGPAKCAPKGTCAFTIDVTNNSNTPIQGPIEIEDTIDLKTATISGAVAAPFACDAGGPPFKCRFSGTLQANETKTLKLDLKFDAPADVKSVKNCATVTQPQGADGAKQDQGQQQKQIAPGKKSDLLPFGQNSLIRFARFRPQSFAHSGGLVHLTGGAGGNIGGVGPNDCLKWGMDRGGFNVTQSDGPQVGFGNLNVGPDGTTTGDASFITDDGPVTGKVQGKIVGSHVDLVVTWNKGVKNGHYIGEIAPDGSFTGTVKGSNGAKASFKTANRIWFQCALDDLCKKYADDAISAVTEFQSLKCGAVGPGRWSTNRDEHITWCMAQSRGGGSPIPGETEARKTKLESCRAFNDKCGEIGAEMVSINSEMETLKCKDTIPALNADKAKDACKAVSIKVDPDSLVPAMKQKLEACKLAKLNGDGGADNPAGGNGAGDPGGQAGDGANGQGGGAAQPPANQCVTVELDEKAPEQGQTGKLALSKNPAAGKCTATGGGCDFVVTVFNPDPAVEFNGPVEFTDHISQPDGSPFPNVTVKTPINPVADSGIKGGGLVCKKDGNDVNCSSLGKSLKIPPGKKIVVPMSFTPGTDTVAKAVKNCASLPGGEQQCATIPFAADGPLLRARKAAIANPQTCMPNCEFTIQMSNVGTKDAEGPFVLKDVFKAANGMDSFRMVGDSKFTCFKTADAIGCLSTNGGTNKLAPGETITAFMMVNVNTVSPEYSNCIEYNPAAQAKPSPFDAESGPLCATIKDTVHDRANIAIRLTAPNEGPDGTGKCELNSPCRFQVRIDSNGVKPYLSNPAFNATVSPNRVSQFGGDATASKNWACGQTDPGLHLLCKNNVVTSMAPSQFVTQEVTIVAGPSWTKNSIMRLCVSLTGQINTFDNFHGDNTDCKSVILDPFNVKVSKTGDQSCAPGSDCHFTLNLFNPGPIDHNAPVTITDQLKGLSSAQILSIKPPLPCATQPTQIPFSCTSPDNVCLDLDGKPGEKCGPQTFEMVVRLPNDASAEQFSNCASVTDGQKNRSDDEACHTVSLTPKTTETPPPPASQPAREPSLPPAPPVTECIRGMVLIGGLCQCPPGTEFNGRRCWSDTGEGHAYPVQSQPELPTRADPQCPRSRPVGVYPNCCPRGMEFKSGACRVIQITTPVRVCPLNRPNGTYPNCCPHGMEFRFGACRRLQLPDTPQGGTNTTRPQTEDNKCPPGMHKVRRPGQRRGGICVPDHGTQTCPPNRPVGTYPKCCPVGMEFKNGVCRRTELPGHSQKGTDPARPQTEGNICPPGTHKVRRSGQRGGGICVPNRIETPKCPPNRPIGTPPNCCPIGTTYRMGRCYADRCAPGMIGRPPHCRPAKTTPTPTPKPTPTGPTPKPVPQKPKCSGDKVPGVGGRCVCPDGTKNVGHNRCGPVVK
jgi:uncharacterized repeat protein (TIGR01451 family)